MSWIPRALLATVPCIHLTHRPQYETSKAKVRQTRNYPLAFQLAPYSLQRKNGQDPQHGPPGPKRFASLPATPSSPFLTHPSQGCSPTPEHAFQNSQHLPKDPQARKALCVPQPGSLAFILLVLAICLLPLSPTSELPLSGGSV